MCVYNFAALFYFSIYELLPTVAAAVVVVCILFYLNFIFHTQWESEQKSDGVAQCGQKYTSAADYDIMRTRNHYVLGSFNNGMAWHASLHTHTHSVFACFPRCGARGGEQFSQRHRAKQQQQRLQRFKIHSCGFEIELSLNTLSIA